MDIMTAFKVKNLRAVGMSQEEVAKKLNISRWSVLRCEKLGFRASDKKLQIADRHSRLIENTDDGNYRTRVMEWDGSQITNSNRETLYNYEFTGTCSDMYHMSPEEVAISMETLEEYAEFIEGDPYDEN